MQSAVAVVETMILIRRDILASDEEGRQMELTKL